MGRGLLDFTVSADRYRAAAALDYKHRITDDLAAFARGEVFRDFDRDEWGGLALAGLRMRF